MLAHARPAPAAAPAGRPRAPRSRSLPPRAVALRGRQNPLDARSVRELDLSDSGLGVISIRHAHESEAPSIAALQEAAHPQAAAWGPHQILDEIRRPCSAVLVASPVMRSAPLGWCATTLPPGDDVVHVLMLTVARAARGHRVGEELLRAGLESCPGAAGAVGAMLEVRAGNAAARRLYERFGFAASRVRRGYYADGEDAIALALALGFAHEGGPAAGEAAGTDGARALLDMGALDHPPSGT